MKKKLTYFALLSLFLLYNPSQANSEEIKKTEIFSASTMAEIYQIFNEINLELILETDISSNAQDILNNNLFVPLSLHIDLNVIGQGKNIQINKTALKEFLVSELTKENTKLSFELVDNYKKGLFNLSKESDVKQNKGISVKNSFGGFFVGEAEYHQEPDGNFHHLLEINQLRLYFSSQINQSSENSMYFLGEWNPVPEEVVHHIDEIVLNNNGKDQRITLQQNKPIRPIPFEQLFFNIKNISNTGFDLTIGQFRNPFGIWSDYTSHRNFSATKNNFLVNGFALKKIELGLLAEKKFEIDSDNTNLNIKGALVQGRSGRTTNLDGVDNDDTHDFVGNIEFSNKNMSLGASAYLSDFSITSRNAYGFNFMIPTKYVSLSGEYVYQKNSKPNQTFNTDLSFKSLSSHSGYVQFNYHIQDSFSFFNNSLIDSISNNLNLYGFYEIWSYYTDEKIFKNPAYKVYHGLRYQFNPNVRWTMVEFGRMFHEGFDKGDIHLSTQLEATF